MKILKTAAKPNPKPKPLAVRIKEAEQLAELDRIERAARFAAEQEEHDRNLRRAELAKVARAERSEIDTERHKELVGRYAPYVPLVLVNMVASLGQFSWARTNLRSFGTSETDPVRIIAAVLFAVTAESIALVLQYHANRALRNRDSAMSLYLAAFTIAGLVASVNYSHYAKPIDDRLFGNPTPTAIIFTLCSLISPWLWRIDSRAKHREALKAAGEIDSRAVKLSMARKFWHPIKSLGVIRRAAWTGEGNPASAVEQWESSRVAKRAERVARKQAAVVAPKALEIEAAPPATKPANKAQKPAQPRVAASMTTDPRYIRGVEIYKLSKQGPGRPLSQRDLAAELGMKNRMIATKVIKDVDEADRQRVNTNNAINNAVPSHT